MDAKQGRILRAALGAVYDGDPDPIGGDTEIRAASPVTGPIDGRRLAIQLVVDAIAKRGVFAESDPSETSPPREQVPNTPKARRIILFDNDEG
jgi:hypothetical protein